MNNTTPTTDEQDLASRIAKRIDDAEFRQKPPISSSRLVRVKGLTSIVLDEIMCFNRQVVELANTRRDERQEELEW